MTITVKLYNRLTGALITDLESANAPEVMATHNEPGNGACELDNDDEDLALVPLRGVLQFAVDGFARFRSLIETIDRQTIAGAEESSEITKLSGRGTLAMFEESVVYPEGGIDARPLNEVRLFNFTAPDFDDAGWGTASQIKQQSDAAAPYAGAPAEWPDPDAYWIWGVAAATPQPLGDCYFRGSFTLAAERTVRIFASADDGLEVYVDGTEVMAETKAYLWATTKFVDIFLTAGAHVVAVKATNIDRPNEAATNVAAFILSVYELTGGGSTLGSLLLRTNNAWKTSAYPSDPPGFTPGRILDILVDEAQARGELPEISLGFTDAVDTDLTPWPDAPDLSFEVGTTLLEVIEQLCESYIDVAMAPNSFELRAWVERGSTQAVALERGVNITDLKHQRRG